MRFTQKQFRVEVVLMKLLYGIHQQVNLKEKLEHQVQVVHQEVRVVQVHQDLVDRQVVQEHQDQVGLQVHQGQVEDCYHKVIM